MTSINSIQTQELPSFLNALEETYGKNWIEKNFAFMAILCEEGAASMFRTMGNGSNANLLKIAHAAIRSVAKMACDQDPSLNERQSVANVMHILAINIGGDLGREGVPDAIFKGVMETRKDEEDSSPSNANTSS